MGQQRLEKRIQTRILHRLQSVPNIQEAFLEASVIVFSIYNNLFKKTKTTPNLLILKFTAKCDYRECKSLS